MLEIIEIGGLDRDVVEIIEIRRIDGRDGRDW